jgi:IS30 family transposase
MDNPNCSTEHRKGQHLTSEERHDIEVHLKDGWSRYKIAKHLNRPYNTIKNEIARGTVALYHGKVHHYKADIGQQRYNENRRSSTRTYRCLETAAFLKYVVKQFREENWSLDACFGRALQFGEFSRQEMVCTKTLYNYVDLGLLPLKNIDLPEKLRRNTKAKRVRNNRKNLGKSIEERPKIVESRKEFGHWEFDSVLGSKNADEPVALTMVERMTRAAIFLRVEDHSATAVTSAIQKLKQEFGTYFSNVFKTITADNGSEFAELSAQETTGTKVYFTHPFSSWEKGTNECHNRMLRRFIPKGKRISDYSVDDILFFADQINALPRKILGYRTPEELLEKELDRIYAA